jgi:cytochrome c-type biogenesis protein CcmH
MVPNFLRFGRFGTVMLVLLAFGLLAAPALAQDVPVTDDDVNAVAKDLFCPVCESTPLDVCPTQACADWRDLIRQQLSEGYTPQEVAGIFCPAVRGWRSGQPP